MSRTALASLAVLLLTAPAASAKRCSQLHQRDLAPAKDVRLVERPNRQNGTDLVGCVLPRGSLHLMAYSSDDGVDLSEYDLLYVKGDKVMITGGSGDQYGGGGGTYVKDIRTLAAYTLGATCTDFLMSGACPPPEAEESLVTARLNDAGQSAAVFTTPSSVAVVGFSTQGARTELDRGDTGAIAPKSLRLRGSTVSWMHAGERRRYTLTG